MTDQASPQIQAVKQIQEMIKGRDNFNSLQLIALKQAINALYYQAEVFNATQKSIDYAQKYVHGPAPQEKKTHRGSEWDAAEENRLVDMWTKNEPLGWIAEFLDRSEVACFMRLEKLKVLTLTEDEKVSAIMLLKNKQKLQNNERNDWIEKAKHFKFSEEKGLNSENKEDFTNEIPSFGEAAPVMESEVKKMKLK